jgi:hypothetical protein
MRCQLVCYPMEASMLVNGATLEEVEAAIASAIPANLHIPGHHRRPNPLLAPAARRALQDTSSVSATGALAHLAWATQQP